MIREVCLFDKFSFCKNGVKCTRVARIENVTIEGVTRGIQNLAESLECMDSVDLAVAADTATDYQRKLRNRTIKLNQWRN